MADEKKSNVVIDKTKLWQFLGEGELTLKEIANKLGIGDKKVSKASVIGHLTTVGMERNDGEGYLVRAKNIKAMAKGGVGNQKPPTYRKTGLNIPNWLLKEKNAEPEIGQEYDFTVEGAVFKLTPK